MAFQRMTAILHGSGLSTRVGQIKIHQSVKPSEYSEGQAQTAHVISASPEMDKYSQVGTASEECRCPSLGRLQLMACMRHL